MANKEITKLIGQLARQGWRIERGKGHYVAYPPDPTQGPVTIATTPGGGRAMANLRATLRRHGARL